MPIKRTRKKNRETGLTNGQEVIAFIEAYCLVPEGSKVGEPIQIAKFQRDFILDVYDNAAGTRRAVMGIARKNGKTALIAAIMLAHICGPRATQNSQIVSGAMSRDQAALVFSLAAKMIQLNPILGEHTRIVPSGKRIIGLSKNVEFRALSADGTTAHGLSPVLAILDEVGQIRGPMSPFVEAILTSQGAHDNPLQIFISTQAASDADFFSQMIDDAERSGDTKTVLHMHRADDGCDLMDKKQWRKANPALGLFRSEADLEEQLKQASRLSSMENSARNLLLNNRISLETLWLAPTIVRENNGPYDMEVFKNNTVHMGLDLALVNDLCCASIAARDDDGFVHVHTWSFSPLGGIADRARRDRVPYDDWARDGIIYAPPGDTLNYDMIAQYLKIQCEEQEISISSINFDRWKIATFKDACERVGFAQDVEWTEVGQGFASMSVRLEAFSTLMLERKLRLGNNSVMNLAMSSAIAVSDPTGALKLDKSKASNKIDAAISALQAVYPLTGNDTAFDAQAMIC